MAMPRCWLPSAALPRRRESWLRFSSEPGPAIDNLPCIQSKLGIFTAQESESIIEAGSKGDILKRLVAVVLFCVGSAVLASAQGRAPEIDPGSGANALALIAGALLVIRGRRKN